MPRNDSHLSNEELVRALDAESPAGEAARIAGHLQTCEACRSRQAQLKSAAAAFARSHTERLDAVLPPPAAVRGLLKARLGALAAQSPERHPWRFNPVWRLASVAALSALAISLAVAVIGRLGPRGPVVPSSRLTPGAVRTASRDDVCSTDLPKNRVVPASLQREVFQAYGLAAADPRKFEVDYLITPALGGADDIRNLWPQPYSATAWNARIKDALEDRLHDMVCGGELDLSTAQQEISRDWIAAYKKYFHTEIPAVEP